MSDLVLRLERISKRFGPLLANDDVSLSLGRSEVLALLGENGAGKTTLMNILFGHYTADEGRVFVFGRELPRGRPRAAIAAGVGMVHQHFALADNLSVLENVMAGTERLWRLRANAAAARRKLLALSERFSLVVDPGARVGDLSVGERQRVEILKCLYRDARILVFDEPTAVLTQKEADGLFATLRQMVAQGLSLIFISHKLREVTAASDRVAILRAGRLVAERKTSETTPDELAELMIGRRVARPERETLAPGDVVLRADRVDVGSRLVNVSFEVRARETLGVIGVLG